MGFLDGGGVGWGFEGMLHRVIQSGTVERATFVLMRLL